MFRACALLHKLDYKAHFYFDAESKWVTGIRGATVKDDMKSIVPTSKFYIEGGFAGNIYLYKWQQKGNHRVCPFYQGFIYKIFP